MKSAKQHYEEWKQVLPNFTEEQERKLYFMMNDYARDYHKSEVKKSTINHVSNSFDLVELERKLDKALKSETSESLKEWLSSKRQ